MKSRVIYEALPTYDKQYQAFDGAPRFSFVEGSTKSGKTAGALDWQFREWINDAGAAEHWWVAPVYGQANIAFVRAKRAMHDAIRYGIIQVNNTDKAFINSKGCVWRFRSAMNEDNLYGEDVRSLVLDEASRASEEAFVSCRSTLTATRGKARVVGNIRGTNNWFYRMCRKIESGGMTKNYDYSKLTSADAVAAGVLDIEEIEEAKRILPLGAFEELYLVHSSGRDCKLFQATFLLHIWGCSELHPGKGLGFRCYGTKRPESRSRLHMRPAPVEACRRSDPCSRGCC